MRKSRLNTNKMFMAGNAILAFAVIIVVVLFVYMSLRIQQEKKDGRNYQEKYNITLVSGFVGDSIALLVNDSTIFSQRITTDSTQISFTKFEKDNSLLIHNLLTDDVSIFQLSPDGGNYSFKKDKNEISQLND